MLLTTIQVLTFDQACDIIRYYTLRWLVERFHFVLKSGCALEDRQLRTADRLQRFLALANVVAWRLLGLTYLGRGRPDLPCTVAFEEYEWQALYAYIHKTAILPRPRRLYSKPPCGSLNWVVSWDAKETAIRALKFCGGGGSVWLILRRLG